MPQYPFCVEIKLQTSDNVQSFISQQRLSGCVSFWSPLCRFRRCLLFCFRALGTRKVFYDAGKSDFEIKEGTPQRCLMGSGVFLYRVTRTKPQHPLIRRGRIVRIRTFFLSLLTFLSLAHEKRLWNLEAEVCPAVRQRDFWALLPRGGSECWLSLLKKKKKQDSMFCHDNAVLCVGVYLLCWLSEEGSKLQPIIPSKSCSTCP